MNIDRVEVNLEDVLANNTALREGVGSSPLVLAGQFTGLRTDELDRFVIPEIGESYRGFEIYANGAINLFVINDKGTHSAYVRIRP